MKKVISLDFILIFILGSLFLLNWDKTEVFNFIIFFVLCLLYLWVDNLIGKAKNEDKTNSLYSYKKFLFFTIIGYLLVVTLVSHIGQRVSNPNIMVHDNVQQVEPAIEFLLNGQNPYDADYTQTELAKSTYIITTQNQVIVNPALFHVISLPGQFILSAPVYILFKQLFGFYDQRIFYLIFFILSIFAVFSFPNKKENKFILTSLYALNPLFLPFFVSGRSDVFVLSFIVLTIYCLKKNKILLSSCMLAIACTSKHSAFFLVPFYYAYLWFKLKSDFKWSQKIKILFTKTWLLQVVFLIIIVPFVLWSPAAFYEDVVAYPVGSLATSYPINGFGVSMWLYELGYIESISDYVPLWIVQIPLSLIFLFLLIRGQKKDSSLSRLVFNYSVLILIYWLFARFFHDNYVGFTSQLFLIAYFVGSNEERITDGN